MTNRRAATRQMLNQRWLRDYGGKNKLLCLVVQCTNHSRWECWLLLLLWLAVCLSNMTCRGSFVRSHVSTVPAMLVNLDLKSAGCKENNVKPNSKWCKCMSRGSELMFSFTLFVSWSDLEPSHSSSADPDWVCFLQFNKFSKNISHTTKWSELDRFDAVTS